MITDSYAELDGKRMRFYQRDGVFFPSVTTVTGYKNDAWLAEWAARIGKEQAAAQQAYAQKRGTLFHSICEIMVPNKDPDSYFALSHIDTSEYSEEEISGARQLADKLSASNALGWMKRVIGQEDPLHCWVPGYGGYGGRYDMLAECVNGKIALIDFKTSKKPKSSSHIDSYYMQLAAYWWAINDNKKIEVDLAACVICNDADSDVQTFFISSQATRKYWTSAFMDRLRYFYVDAIPNIDLVTSPAQVNSH